MASAMTTAISTASSAAKGRTRTAVSLGRGGT